MLHFYGQAAEEVYWSLSNCGAYQCTVEMVKQYNNNNYNALSGNRELGGGKQSQRISLGQSNWNATEEAPPNKWYNIIFAG